ncbi:MAG: restriction endonuclease [Terrimicrobiaceae bacterium]
MKKVKPPSPIDNLYREIFGNLPAKRGTAYERLAAAALKLTYPEIDTIHDTRIRGLFSETLHQIDVLADKGTIVGEAKDYTDRNAKVGLSDMQKLAGALVDLPGTKGAFFSATDFTKPAIKYANATEKMFGKATELFELRPSVASDSEGRIQQITFRLHIITPDYKNSQFAPVYTEIGNALMLDLERDGLIGAHQPWKLHEVLRADGTQLITIEELTRNGFSWVENQKEEASWVLPGGYIQVCNTLIPIHGISYVVPKHEEIRESSITAKGRGVLILKSLNGDTDKLISDFDLKKVVFDDNGNVAFNVTPQHLIY